MSFKKNTAVTGFPFHLISATDGSDITSGTVTVYYTLDGGAQTSLGTGAVHEGNGEWSITLTAASLNGDVVGITCTHTSAITAHFTIKTDTKIVSELNDFDPAADDVATVTAITNAVVLPAIPTNWITAAGITAGALDGKGNWNIGKTGYTVSTVSDKTGYSLTQSFPTNFADMAIAVTTGKVTVGTNDDKTGYTVSTVSDKTGYSISGAITTLDGLNNFDPAADTVGTVTTLTNLPAITSNWITAAGITAGALDGKGNWNIGKTGYTVSTVSDKTGYSISGSITTLDGLNNISTTEVNTEVVDALNVDTYGEPAQGAPSATASIQYKTSYVYKVLINKKTADSTDIEIYNAAGSVVDHKRTISDDATTYTENAIVSGP